MSLFPSEAEQIEQIAEAESVPETLPAFSIPQEDIDLLLIFGSNDNAGRMKIATEFMKQKSVEDLAAFLKKTYRGAYGIEMESGRFSSFAADDGIHFAIGDGAEYERKAQVLSWPDAAARIGQLLEEGRYATNVELTEAPGFERQEIAQSLLYLAHDLSKEAREAGVLSVMDQYEGGGYPDMTLRVSTALIDPEKREAILQEYRAFYQAWQQDHDLLRFRFYRPAELLQRLEELNLPRRSYETDMRELPQVRHFITEDDITDALRRRVPYQNGKNGIYQYWQEPHTAKEKAVFLKDLYGTGGGNAAFSHNFLADEDYNSKGIRLRKPQCGDVLMTWAQVAKRIYKLMAQDRYLTAEEKAKLNSVIEEQAAPPAYISEYNSIKEAHPDELVLFQRGDFFELYGEDARAASELAQLTLTTREVPGSGRMEMAGFPAYALEQYSKVLRDLKNYLSVWHPNESMSSTCWLFFTIRHGQKCPICDDTARYRIQKYVTAAKEKCREVPDNPHPHLWRHSRAMHIYQHGMDLERISQWLGHSQLETTLIYAHVDTEDKRKAIEAALGGGVIASLGSAPYTIDDEELLRRLYGL